MIQAGPVREAFEQQAKACHELGSPFTGQLCKRLIEILDDGSSLGRVIGNWPLDPVNSALALRLCGALHWMVRSGKASALAQFYPPATETGAAFDDGLRAVIAELDEDLVAYLRSAPQTNEVARSGVLLGGLLTIANAVRLPLALYEIGASAGLNLHPDCYAYELGQKRRWGSEGAPLTIDCNWSGAIPPLDAPLTIAARTGADLAPIDPADHTARERVLAYIWPDQPNRLQRVATAMAYAAAHRTVVERAEAADWIEAQLAEPPRAGIARVLMHSISWQYFPESTQHRITAAMTNAGAAATQETPLAWLWLEPDGQHGSAATMLKLWPSGEMKMLGRGDYHGRFAVWEAE